MHPFIKFTAKWSYESVSFHNINGSLDAEGQLTTDLYTKPTDNGIVVILNTACKCTISYSMGLAYPRYAKEAGSHEHLVCGACKESLEHVLFKCASHDFQRLILWTINFKGLSFSLYF